MIKKYTELTEAQLNAIDNIGILREEYTDLLAHHIEETEHLYGRIKSRKGPSIIVIGPDRVGKTTVAAHLSAELSIPGFKCPAEKQIFKNGGRSSLAFDYTLTHFIPQTGIRFVSDRGYPCEWVYSKVFGRETDDQLLEMIDAGHEYIGTKILYLYSSVPPTEEDDLVPADKYLDVKNKYDDFCKWSSISVCAIDTAEMLEAFRNGWDTSRATALKCIKLMGL